MSSTATTPRYFTLAEYQQLRDHCRCTCTHTRKQHDHTMYCTLCACRRYGRRQGWKRGGKKGIHRKPARVQSSTPGRKPVPDDALLEQVGESGEEWQACMYFDDVSEVIEVCGDPGENVATIEVPLGVVDVTWRKQLAPALTYDNSVTKPAAHYFERGCYVTMPLVLCAEHRRAMLR